MAPRRIDLPAPVSPVMTEKPSEKSRSSASMSAKISSSVFLCERLILIEQSASAELLPMAMAVSSWRSICRQMSHPRPPSTRPITGFARRPAGQRPPMSRRIWPQTYGCNRPLPGTRSRAVIPPFRNKPNVSMALRQTSPGATTGTSSTSRAL